MPALQTCDSDFLLQLLAGEKLLLVKPETLPSDEALATCSLSRKKMAKLCSLHPIISNYLPNDPSRVPLEHLCCLLYALDPQQYASQVKDATSKPALRYKKHRSRSIRREFADILLKLQASGEGLEDFLDLGKRKAGPGETVRSPA